MHLGDAGRKTDVSYFQVLFLRWQMASEIDVHQGTPTIPSVIAFFDEDRLVGSAEPRHEYAALELGCVIRPG